MKKNRSLYTGMEIVTRQLEESEQQLARLLDLYVSGDFDKEMLIERKSSLESTICKLKHEKIELEARINAITYSDEDIASLEAFCATIKTKLNMATFEDKRHILDMLDVRGTLAIEDDEKVIYISCKLLTEPQRRSPARTSPSLNIGGTVNQMLVYQQMDQSQ